MNGPAQDPDPTNSERAVSTAHRFNLGTIATAALTFVGLVAGTIVGVYTAIYLIAPDLQPKEKLGASISDISIENAVPLYRYLRVMGETADPNEEPERPGAMVFVSATIVGFTDRSYSMSVSAIDAINHVQPEPGIESSELRYVSTCETLPISANEDVVSWRCWIDGSALPPDKYIIRAELYDAGPTKELASGELTGKQHLLHFLESAEMDR